MKRLNSIFPILAVVLLLSVVGCSFFVLSEAELANNDGFDSSDLGLYAEAISHYDKAIQLNPDYVDAYLNRGFAYKKLDQYQRAIQDYDKAIQLDRNYAYAYYIRGLAYHNLGQTAKAKADFAKACSLDIVLSYCTI